MNSKTESPRERVYQAYWQDGSIDLFAGLALVFIGIGWLAGQVALSSTAPAIMLPVWISFRAKFIETRLGYVRFDAPRRGQMRRANLILIGVGCLTLLLGIALYFVRRNSAASGDWVREIVPALPASLVGLGGILSALMFGIHRLALYGMACVIAGAVVALLHTDPGWSLLAGGCVATVAGLVLLMRFFRLFPPLPSEIE